MNSINLIPSRLILVTAALALLTPLRAEETPALKVDPAPVSRQAGVITSFAPVVEKVAPSVVQIATTKEVKPGRNPMFNDPFYRHLFGIPDEDEGQAPDQPRQQRPRNRRGIPQKEALGLGSGVIVSAEGHILTNNHVVEGADDILVTLPGDKKEYKAKKIGTDPGTDLAVLKIENGKSHPAITFGDSDKLRVGDFTIAVGNPFGLTQSVTMGIVSSLGRNDMGIVAYENFIQTDASINPGNSGGALVDIDGRLIGINTAIFSRTGTSAGIGFAVPANLARQIMDSLVKTGKVVRGFLGVKPDAITEDLARKLKFQGTDGALIATVEEKSPAEKAGIEPGDVITEINGHKILGPSELRMTVSNLSPGTNVKLKYVRDGQEKVTDAVLSELQNKRIASADVEKPESTDPDVLDGVTVADLDAEARRKYGIPENINGVVVTGMEPDSACADAGVRVGDVIQEIERKKVKDANAAVEMSEQLKKEKEVMLRISTKGVSRFIIVKE
jgi:serine protease Do